MLRNSTIYSNFYHICPTKTKLETFISFFASKPRFDLYSVVNKVVKLVFYFKISPSRHRWSVIKIPSILTAYLLFSLTLIFNSLQIIFYNFILIINLTINELTKSPTNLNTHYFKPYNFFYLRPQFVISNGRTF